MSLLDDIEAWLDRTGSSPTAFGMLVGKHNSFVAHLRAGRRVGQAVERRARAVMAAFPDGIAERARPSERIAMDPVTFSAIEGSRRLRDAVLAYFERRAQRMRDGGEAAA